MLRQTKLLISGLLIGSILTALCFAKDERPELWEEVYKEGDTIWCVDINHIVCYATYDFYFFLVREYNPKTGYKIYSCDWAKNLYHLSWKLRWKGSEHTDKRTALPVEPKYYKANRAEGDNTGDCDIFGRKLPLKKWQEAVTRYVMDEVMIHPEFTTFIDNMDRAPLLPNYPYSNGRRR